MFPALLRSLKGVSDKYLVSPEGQFLPSSPLRKPREEQQAYYKDYFSNAAMGAVNAPVSSPGLMVKQIQGLDQNDLRIMEEFIDQIRGGKARQPLERLGKDAHAIAEGLGLSPTTTNKALAGNFESLLRLHDAHKVVPQVPGLKQITPGAQTPPARPWHQMALEKAANAKDWRTVGTILDKIPADDPYKSVMERMFRPKTVTLNQPPEALRKTMGGVPTVF
jgi:hypothetical protein